MGFSSSVFPDLVTHATCKMFNVISYYQKKHRRKSAKQKPGLSYAVRQAQVCKMALIRMINPFVKLKLFLTDSS